MRTGDELTGRPEESLNTIPEVPLISSDPQIVLLRFKDYFMCMNVLPLCLYVHYMLTWCPQRSEEGVGSSGTRVIDGFELPCGGWELNPSSVRARSTLNH